MGYGTSIGENYVLVGGLEHVFPFFGNFIIPTDELIFFRGLKPPTRICLSIVILLNINVICLVVG